MDTTIINALEITKPVKHSTGLNDKLIQQLLGKLDEGTETITNLRSLLTVKSAELDQLVGQLELINQVLDNVEYGTEQIELVLKDMTTNDKQDKPELAIAKATLDSAIESASNLVYNNENYYYYSDNKVERKQILNKLNSILKQLGINPIRFIKSNFTSNNKQDDIKVLQKAHHDLDLAKELTVNIKTKSKKRSALLRNENASIQEIKQLGKDIRREFKLYKSFTKNATPSLLDKENIISILDREDGFLKTIVAQKQHNHQQQHGTTSLLMFSRHTSSSAAKQKKPAIQTSLAGSGSHLRFRNILTKKGKIYSVA